ASYRLAMLDRNRFPDMRCRQEKDEDESAYSNSSQPPFDAVDDPFALLDHQDAFQIKYTGGTVLHFWLGERIEDPNVVKNFVRAVCSNYKLPYFTLTPTFSICPEHGYIAGEKPECPQCGDQTEIYSRIVGYLRPIQQWNQGKRSEFNSRALFDGKIQSVQA
ncbi:MAG: anaerobic ribonucleoside-triphosphate reductase, partial [Acidobacteriota bacterium]